MDGAALKPLVPEELRCNCISLHPSHLPPAMVCCPQAHLRCKIPIGTVAHVELLVLVIFELNTMEFTNRSGPGRLLVLPFPLRVLKFLLVFRVIGRNIKFESSLRKIKF